ncbi:MAG TPA: hypothetical protein DCS09_11820 [Porphyromonadaceae bacterium]|nr:hypothetical protein [Porphyromonadaceae bacterium]
MEITSTFEVQNCDVYFEIESFISFNQSNQVVFNIGSELFVDNRYAYGYVNFPAFGSFGTDETFANIGVGYANFPAFTSSGQADVYTPPQPGQGYGFFPPFSSSGYAVDIGIGTGLGTFPAFISKGGDYEYGEGAVDFPAFGSFGIEGSTAKEILLFSVGLVKSDTDMFRETVIILNSTGAFVSSFTATRQVVAELLSYFQGSSMFSVIGEFNASLLSSAVASSQMVGAVNNAPAIDGLSRVWVVNMETAASSQYDRYGFNSFFERDGEYFGVADDGIYKLDGDDDDGVDIDVLIEIGSSNYGTYKDKKSTGLEIGCSSTGVLILKITVDGIERLYRMTRTSSTIETHNIPVSHRQVGSQWNITLINENGCDLDISDIDFRIFPTTRRSR